MLLFPSVCAWLYVFLPHKPRRAGHVPSARSRVLREHTCGCSVGVLWSTAWEDVRAIGAAAQQRAARLPLLGDEVRGLMRETLKFTFHVDKQSKISLAC